mmetsp:Transcript_61142/g.129129  ORF Transcript_61142/g.129129 Transcript_61142/m.129129 type:complete len:382 (+) Transcript_61142:93-1238(+)
MARQSYRRTDGVFGGHGPALRGGKMSQQTPAPSAAELQFEQDRQARQAAAASAPKGAPRCVQCRLPQPVKCTASYADVLCRSLFQPDCAHGPFCARCRRSVSCRVLPSCVCRALVNTWHELTWPGPTQAEASDGVVFGPELPPTATPMDVDSTETAQAAQSPFIGPALGHSTSTSTGSSSSSSSSTAAASSSASLSSFSSSSSSSQPSSAAPVGPALPPASALGAAAAAARSSVAGEDQKTLVELPPPPPDPEPEPIAINPAAPFKKRQLPPGSDEGRPFLRPRLDQGKPDPLEVTQRAAATVAAAFSSKKAAAAAAGGGGLLPSYSSSSSPAAAASASAGAIGCGGGAGGHSSSKPKPKQKVRITAGDSDEDDDDSGGDW